MSNIGSQEEENQQPQDKTKSGASARNKKGTMSNSLKLDPKNPIPIEYNGNMYVTLKGKRYVPFLNPKDNFAQFLSEARLLSPTTKSCVSSKAEYCLGKGWYLKNKGNDPELTAWAKNVNRKQESLNDIIKGYFLDEFAIGNGYIEVVRGEVAGKRFVRVYRRNYLDCRLSEPDEDDICTSVFISKHFRKIGLYNMKDLNVVEVPIYTPNMFDNPWAVDDKGFHHTIFHLKNDEPGYDYYGMPSNIGSLVEQLLEYKYGRHNLDDLDNNMVMGGIVTIKGATTREEATKTAKDLINTHTGDGKVGRWMVISSESGISEGTEVEQFNTQKEGSYVEADLHNEAKIYIANQWNKLLIGGSEAKGMGSGNSAYIRAVFDIANNTVIAPAQERFLEKFLQPLFQICDEWMGTKWSRHDIGLKTVMPISFLGDIDVNSIITKNEGREIIGKPALEGDKGDEFISNKPAPVVNNNPNPENA